MERDLVYDVGLHRGEDTAMYLAQGYRVVAFEANPELCAHCRDRFAEEIAQGRLTIVEGAIADSSSESITFYVHSALSVWGTTDREWVERNRELGESRSITVPVVNFASWLEQTGMPLYMKVDIEGADQICLEVLRGFEERPAYVSMESSETGWREVVSEFDRLASLGYDQFAVVQQRMARTVRSLTTVDGRRIDHQLEADCSGPFGADLTRWESRAQASRRFRGILLIHRLVGEGAAIRRSGIGVEIVSVLEHRLSFPLRGWYDTHARCSADVGHSKHSNSAC